MRPGRADEMDGMDGVERRPAGSEAPEGRPVRRFDVATLGAGQDPPGVKINTHYWERRHGGEHPAGDGSWVFSMGGLFEVIDGSWSRAARTIMVRAAQRGYRGEIVLRG